MKILLLAAFSALAICAAAVPSQGTTSPPTQAKETRAWISSTGKRHAVGCRHYGQGEGHYTRDPREGVACKICGG